MESIWYAFSQPSDGRIKYIMCDFIGRIPGSLCDFLQTSLHVPSFFADFVLNPFAVVPYIHKYDRTEFCGSSQRIIKPSYGLWDSWKKTLDQKK